MKLKQQMSKSFAAVRELDPTPDQIVILQRNIGAVRFAQNWALSFVKSQLSSKTKQSWSSISLHTAWREYREEVAPWYVECSKESFQYGTERASKALKNFANNRKHFKFPKFRKRGHNDSICYTTARLRSPNTVQLPRIGNVSLKESFGLPENTRITGVFVRPRAGRWFVTFRLKNDTWAEPAKRYISNVVGVDAGVGSWFATLSDSTVVENPRFFRKAQCKLSYLSKDLRRKQKGSNNRRKALDKIAVHHYKTSNKRKDFIHKFTTNLVKTHDEIVIEDLNLHGMKSSLKLGKSVSDVAWAEVRRQLEYKSSWYGTTLTIVSRWFPSSKQCHVCKYIYKELTLSDRTWVCTSCNTKHDRDLNAALNLLTQSSVSVLAASSVVSACGDGVIPQNLEVAVSEPGSPVTFANRI